MSYSYNVCFCRECLNMDLKRRCPYDDSKAYCTERGQYYNPNEKACSRYFVYDESRRQNNSCYLTTIICNVLGYEDDCEYLQILRNFRDNYMKKTIELLPLLYEYDIVGPLLAININDDINKKDICEKLFNRYIIKVVELIKNEQYDNAIELYTTMVIKLKAIYYINTPILNIEEPEIITGKGYLLKNN